MKKFPEIKADIFHLALIRLRFEDMILSLSPIFTPKCIFKTKVIVRKSE